MVDIDVHYCHTDDGDDNVMSMKILPFYYTKKSKFFILNLVSITY